MMVFKYRSFLQFCSTSEMSSVASGTSSDGNIRKKRNSTDATSAASFSHEDSRSKAAMSASTSDDSCAINELLEGRMDLCVILPDNTKPVFINVERRMPMMDLLVKIATQYHFNAANYTISAGDHEFKASNPIGSLDVNQITIVPKPLKTSSTKNSANQQTIPFQATFRLQVNLPRNQLMVLRVTPNAAISAIKQIICSEKGLDPLKYQLVRTSSNDHAMPSVLEPNKALAFYGINEITLMSNRQLSQQQMQYGATSSQIDLDSTPMPSSSSQKKSGVLSLMLSQSNVDLSTINKRATLPTSQTSSKLTKKRPAPPPPVSTANVSNSQGSNCENIETIIALSKSDPVLTKNKSQVKPVIRSGPKHVRQNSGSDSSGYHESVLSSDSPEFLPPLSPNVENTNDCQDAKASSKNQVNQRRVVRVTKKRRAPLPPSTTSIKENETGVEEKQNQSLVISECTNELPISCSSSTSAASEISLGPSVTSNELPKSPTPIAPSPSSPTIVKEKREYSNENCLKSGMTMDERDNHTQDVLEIASDLIAPQESSPITAELNSSSSLSNKYSPSSLLHSSVSPTPSSSSTKENYFEECEESCYSIEHERQEPCLNSNENPGHMSLSLSLTSNCSYDVNDEDNLHFSSTSSLSSPPPPIFPSVRPARNELSNDEVLKNEEMSNIVRCVLGDHSFENDLSKNKLHFIKELPKGSISPPPPPPPLPPPELFTSISALSLNAVEEQVKNENKKNSEKLAFSKENSVSKVTVAVYETKNKSEEVNQRTREIPLSSHIPPPVSFSQNTIPNIIKAHFKEKQLERERMIQSNHVSRVNFNSPDVDGCSTNRSLVSPESESCHYSLPSLPVTNITSISTSSPSSLPPPKEFQDDKPAVLSSDYKHVLLVNVGKDNAPAIDDVQQISNGNAQDLIPKHFSSTSKITDPREALLSEIRNAKNTLKKVNMIAI